MMGESGEISPGNMIYMSSFSSCRGKKVGRLKMFLTFSPIDLEAPTPEKYSNLAHKLS